MAVLGSVSIELSPQFTVIELIAPVPGVTVMVKVIDCPMMALVLSSVNATEGGCWAGTVTDSSVVPWLPEWFASPL